MPMRFKAHREMVLHLFERFELANPVDNALADGSPLIPASRLHHRIFAVTVADTILWKQCPTIGKRYFAERSRVARIPIQHQVWCRNGSKDLCRLGACASVAGHFIFEDERDTLFAHLVRSFSELCIDRLAVRSLIV